MVRIADHSFLENFLQTWKLHNDLCKAKDRGERQRDRSDKTLKRQTQGQVSERQRDRSEAKDRGTDQCAHGAIDYLTCPSSCFVRDGHQTTN